MSTEASNETDRGAGWIAAIATGHSKQLQEFFCTPWVVFSVFQKLLPADRRQVGERVSLHTPPAGKSTGLRRAPSV